MSRLPLRVPLFLEGARAGSAFAPKVDCVAVAFANCEAPVAFVGGVGLRQRPFRERVSGALVPCQRRPRAPPARRVVRGGGAVRHRLAAP